MAIAVALSCGETKSDAAVTFQAGAAGEHEGTGGSAAVSSGGRRSNQSPSGGAPVAGLGGTAPTFGGAFSPLGGTRSTSGGATTSGGETQVSSGGDRASGGGVESNAGASGASGSAGQSPACAEGDCPLSLPGALAGAAQSSCALVGDGSVKCWGRNYYGQLGAAVPDDPPQTAIQVEALSGVRSLAAGDFHTCALLEAGTVHCWGIYSALGREGLEFPGTPEALPVPNLDGVVMISAGGYRSCALRSDASVWCWTDAAPQPIAGVEGATYIASGERLDCAIVAGGSVVCWSEEQPAPAAVDDVTDAIVLAIGKEQACALRVDRTVTCWGRLTALVTGASQVTGAIGIGVGTEHACALLHDGSVVCWGENDQGRLGRGNTDAGLPLEPVSGLDGTVRALDVGNTHTCVLLDDDEPSAWCWGNGLSGQLGNGTLADTSVPRRVLDFP